MRLAAALAAQLALVALITATPSALAQAPAPWRPYLWAQRATLIVEGRVEAVGESTGTLRVTRILAGACDTETISFAPVTHPVCMSGLRDPVPPDVAVGDEIALFLVRADTAAYEVVDNGFAKVDLRDGGALIRAPAASVRRLVEAMKIADQDARDRAMIAAATADEQFLRRAACEYVRDDLGVAARPAGTEGYRCEPRSPWYETHAAAVRRHAAALAALVKRENGEEPCDAALASLADASCAPEGAFDAILRYARATRDLGQESFASACRVIALYDRADAVDAVVGFAANRPCHLSALGASPRPEARARLLAEFEGPDPRRAAEAARGLGGRLARRPDEAVANTLLGRLARRTDVALDEAICGALLPARGADAAALLLDELASEPLSAARGEFCAKTLHSYAAAQPYVAGLRELLLTRQDVLIRRLDSGDAVSVRLVYLLEDLRTPEANAALRRAAKSSPDPQVRSQAKAWLESTTR